MKIKHAKKRGILGPIRMVLAFMSVLVIGVIVSRFTIHPTTVSYCANSISCVKDLTGTFDPNGTVNTFMGQKVSLPASLTYLQTPPRVLGASTGVKHIFVNLSTQTLTAYDGAQQVMSFPVATGRWHPTPTGDFHIWVKLRYAHMEGGNKDDGTYYNLSNVPYVMFFYNDDVAKSLGFSLHGAYWHNNFGHPMSHGCVNIRPEDAGKLYAWADPENDGNITYATSDHPGTLVTISGETPDE